jgi:ribosomal protein S18 acetylase RimI-like enzyme
MGFKPAPLTHDYAARVAAAQVFLAESDTIRGLVVLISQPDHLFVENIAVISRYQGEGVGRRLLRHAETIAGERGLRALRLITNALMTTNLSRYERWGFRRTHLSSVGGFTIVHMSKTLEPAGPG